MAINELIASGIKLPQFNLPDYGADMAQMAQIQNARNQNALAQYQLGAAQRAEEESLGIKNYLTQNAGKTPAELQSGLFQFGAPGIAIAKALNEQQNAQLTRQKTQQDIDKSKREFADQSFRNISLNPSDENIKAWAQDAVIQNFMTQEEANAKAQSLLSMSVPERQAYMASQGANSKELIALFESKPVKQTDGQQEWFVETNKRLPNFGQPITEKVQLKVTPGQQLSAQVNREGQEVTREGQRIVAETAAAGQESVAKTAAARLEADVKNWNRMDLLARDQLAAQIENWDKLDARAKATLQESVRSTNLQDARARAALAETIRNNNVTSAQRNRQLSISEQNAARENDPVFQQRMAEAKAAGQAAGKDAATAARVLPNAIARSEELVGLLDQMIGKRDAQGKLEKGQAPYQGFKDAVGFGFGTRFIPGTPAANFDALFKQTQGGAFLEAFETLKGGGAISEKEGEKATAARTRMSLAQSEDEFVNAAQDYIKVLKNGVATAKNKLGNTSAKPNVIDFGSLK